MGLTDVEVLSKLQVSFGWLACASAAVSGLSGLALLKWEFKRHRLGLQKTAAYLAIAAALSGAVVVAVSSRLSDLQTASLGAAGAKADSARQRVALLEKHQVPRRVAGAGQSAFVGTLRASGFLDIEIQAPGEDPEAMDFGLQLGRLVARAGWRVEGSRVLPVQYPSMPVGLRLFVGDSSAASTQAAALVDALRSAGYDCALLGADDLIGKPTRARLIVGKKPPPEA